MSTTRFEGPRGIRPEELNRLIGLLDMVFRPQTPTMAREHGCMYCPENAAFLRVMLADGKPVSHFGLKPWNISLLGVPLRMVSAGGVCTHPDYRHRGLATVLLHDAERQVHAAGADLVLVSGGRGLYQTNGYGPAGCYREFTIDAPTAAFFDNQSFRVRACRPADLGSLAALSEREPVRYHRPFHELARLVAGRRARSIPDEFSLVTLGDRPVAWLDIATTPDGRTRNLWEYAGDRDAVLAGLAAHIKPHPSAGLTVTVTVPAHDPGMIARLEVVRPGRDTVLPDHTVKIPDFRGFMDKMKPVFEQHVDPEGLDGLSFENAGESGVIRWGGESLVVEDPRQRVRLVFGPAQPDGGNNMGGGNTRIAEFIRTALPLPLVWPGINYV